MTRKEGFIEVDKMLEEIGVDTTDLNSILKSNCINLLGGGINVHFSFPYRNETYFFKSTMNLYPYNDLIANELARDFDIPCVEYDLAILGSDRGVLSKDFRLEHVTYTYGYDILNNYEKNTGHFVIHSLEHIWDALEYRYQKRDVVSKLMVQIVNMYLFDIITYQIDRHSSNWEIMESKDSIDVAPLYDNECIGLGSFDSIIGLTVDGGDVFKRLSESIERFQKVSDEEFTNIIKDRLWIIGEENLHKVFDRIEKKIGYSMPDKEKKFYLNSYREHKEKLEEILGLTEEREEPNEGKNR